MTASKFLKFTGLFWLMFFLCSSVLAADKECSQKVGPWPVGMINSSNGGVYEPGQFGLIFKYIYKNQDQLYDGDSKEDFVKTKKMQCPKRTLQVYQATMRYGIVKNFDARLVVPVYEKYMKRESTTKTITDTNFRSGRY